MTMHNALHPIDDIDRPYTPRKEEGRGLAGIEDSVITSMKRFEDYIKKRKERLITAPRNKTDNTRIKRTTISRKQQWEEK